MSTAIYTSLLIFIWDLHTAFWREIRGSFAEYAELFCRYIAYLVFDPRLHPPSPPFFLFGQDEIPKGPVPEGIWQLNAKTFSLKGRECSGMEYKIGYVCICICRHTCMCIVYMCRHTHLYCTHMWMVANVREWSIRFSMYVLVYFHAHIRTLCIRLVCMHMYILHMWIQYTQITYMCVKIYMISMYALVYFHTHIRNLCVLYSHV